MRRTIIGVALALMMSSEAASALTTCPEQFSDKAWDATGRTSKPAYYTCVPLTERLLVSLEGATKAEVIRAMEANGGPLGNEQDTLHFFSVVDSSGGWINFRFENDRVVIIFGQMDDGQFIWNQAKRFTCSDLGGSYGRCNK